jgi:hypothetical protein
MSGPSRRQYRFRRDAVGYAHARETPATDERRQFSPGPGACSRIHGQATLCSVAMVVGSSLLLLLPNQSGHHQVRVVG